MRGGDGQRLAQAQLKKIGDRHVAVEPFRLVHRQEHRLAAAARQLRHELVLGRDAGPAIHQYDQTIRLADRPLGLRNHQALDHVRLLHESAGIDHDARDVRAPCESVLAIARQPRQIGHQRIARASHGIE